MSHSQSYQTEPTRSKTYKNQQSNINFTDKRALMETPNELLAKFKEIIKSRGVKGMIRLQKILKQKDHEGNNKLNVAEFKKALKDYKIENL